MSRSRPNHSGLNSPVQGYLQWAGKEGELSYYDKDTKKTTVLKTVDLIILDELHSVAGYQQGRKGAPGKMIRGTRVRDIKNENIKVYIGKELRAEARYEDLKTSVNGLKYAKAVYALMLGRKENKIVEFLMTGSSFSGYLNFCNATEDYEGGDKVKTTETGVGVAIVGRSKLKKNGDSKYYEPLFEVFDLEESDEESAISADEKLQKYLDKLLNADYQPEEEEEEDPEEPEEEEEEEEKEKPRPSRNSKTSKTTSSSSRNKRKVEEEEEEEEDPEEGEDPEDDEPDVRSALTRGRRTTSQRTPAPTGKKTSKVSSKKKQEEPEEEDDDPDDLPF